MKNFGNVCFYTFCLILFWSAEVGAKEVEFYFYPNEFKLGEHAKLEVKAFGDKLFKPLNHSIRKNGISIIYIGSGMETQIVNSTVYKNQILTFQVKSDREGDFTLPEISVRYGQDLYTSPPFTFQVRGKRTSNPFFSFFAEEPEEENRAEVSFHTNKESVYVGETFVGYYVLYYNGYKRPYLERDPNMSISFPFCLTEPLQGISVQIEPKVKMDGQWLETLVSSKEIYALTPLKPGKTKMGKTNFFVGDSLRFISSQNSIPTREASISVLELPKPMPSTFRNTIGEYEMRLLEFPKEIFSETPLYFRIRIEGEGSITGNNPPLEWSHSADKIQLISMVTNKNFQKLKNGNYGFYTQMNLLFSYPTEKNGTLSLPDAILTFFSPSLGKYQTTTLKFPSVFVQAKPSKSSGTSSAEILQNAPKEFGILPLLLLAFLGPTLYVGLRALQKKRELQILTSAWEALGKKRGLLLADYLLRKGLDETDSKFYSNLVGDRNKEDFLLRYSSLQQGERKKILELSKIVFQRSESK